VGDFRELAYEVDAGVSTITLSRPDTLNAVTSIMLDPWWTDPPFTA
jgi:enoyl-CoA hydratase/carnithine racemase